MAMTQGRQEAPSVVVLGAGFAGLGAMRELRKSPVTVTLLDLNDYHTFQPLLYQVATAELDTSEVAFPVRDMLHDRSDWRFHQANVTSIDLDARTVTAEGLAPIPYDYVVVGLGAQVNYYGTSGAAEHAFPMYTMSDAVRLKRHVLQRFEAADRDPKLVDQGALTFSVVGGGATGVETAGALAELINTELKEDYPNLNLERAGVHLFELGPELLAPFKPNLRAYAKKALEERDVHVHLNEGVTEVGAGSLRLRSGEEVKTQTLVWAAGLSASPLASLLGVELVHGRVPVEADLSLTGHPEVFVAGDIAAIKEAKTGDVLPQLGSVAQQAGRQAGDNIARLVKGHHSEPFQYHDKGTMATVGRGAAVVEFRSGRTMTGHAAWMAWLGVHLMLLSGGEEKSLTFLDWGWNLIANNRGKRIHVE
jgi:NADH:quinone reductase (non-electrogenic)